MIKKDDEGEPGSQFASAHNQSVVKAAALIGCFVDRAGGKTLTELAQRTGLNVSTAYRMLQTLVLTGVLRRDAESERYSVGPMLLALAGSTFSQGGFDVVLDVLRDLAEKTGESVSLGIRDGDCVAVLLAAGSRHHFRFEHRAGDRIPIHCSGMGKVLLAKDSRDLAIVVAELGVLHAMTPNSIISPQRLVAELQSIRDRGFAFGEQEHHEGVRSLAVPLTLADGQTVGAIGVQAPFGRMTEARIGQLHDLLQEGATLIARLPIQHRLWIG